VAIREALLAALRDVDAVVVSGETGSGKTCAVIGIRVAVMDRVKGYVCVQS